MQGRKSVIVKERARQVLICGRVNSHGVQNCSQKKKLKFATKGIKRNINEKEQKGNVYVEVQMNKRRSCGRQWASSVELVEQVTVMQNYRYVQVRKIVLLFSTQALSFTNHQHIRTQVITSVLANGPSRSSIPPVAINRSLGKSKERISCIRTRCCLMLSSQCTSQA